ncbi:hypothetical protein V6N13_001782 [Hibiscus sabdariffa]|uniref:Uncharacterized protein n=1 Tax=Hibiscus sabdariffa TaxID=183260 RepID=A0ABR2GA97_9ROSI
MDFKDLCPPIWTWKIINIEKLPWKKGGIVTIVHGPSGRRSFNGAKVEDEDFCEKALSKGQKSFSFPKPCLREHNAWSNHHGIYVDFDFIEHLADERQNYKTTLKHSILEFKVAKISTMIVSANLLLIIPKIYLSWFVACSITSTDNLLDGYLHQG